MSQFSFIYFFQVLAQWADHVETVHRVRWEEQTRNMSLVRQLNFRRKLDLVLPSFWEHVSGLL
jgi:hypothetical protein